MSHHNHVPVRTAQRVSLETGNDIVVIIAWNQNDNVTHMATYGKTLSLCDYAAEAGSKIAGFLGLRTEEGK